MSCSLHLPSEAPPPGQPAETQTESGRKVSGGRSNNPSQRIRRTVQLLFLALNVWIGVQFYFFVRYYETGGTGWKPSRPPGVEGWLPIASLMNWKAYLLTGEFPPMHAAGMFLLASFVVVSFLFRKSFCSWLCPVGTISELLWKLGRETFHRNRRLPRRFDIALRSLKYILLGLFLYAVAAMSVPAIRAFLDGPYGVVADVKMMNFFRYLGITGAVVLGLLVVLSIFIQNFWCRYLCPYGALLGLFARFSPVRIRRTPSSCIDCASCSEACPSLLPVDRLITVRSPECTGCYECIAACPVEDALEMSVASRKRLPAWAMAAGVVILFLGFVGYAHWSGHWHTNLPDSVYYNLIPSADAFQHP